MIVLVIVFFFTSVCYAERGVCDLSVSILNQEPFPAVPGDVVEIVFMLSGLDTTDCGVIDFEIFEEYPFSIMPYDESKYAIQSGTYTKGYSPHKTIPVDFKVHEDALDGDNPLEIGYRSSFEEGSHTQKFNIEVQDVKADFEIFVSSYNYATKEIKFEILNIGKSDIEAVTIEVPAQKNVRIYDSNKENIGDLSSNEDTSAEFKADVNGESINLLVSYSDATQERRTLGKNVVFDSKLFEATNVSNNIPAWYWIIGALILIIIYYYYSKKKKQRKK